jgi:hypothetical protein
MKTNGKVGLTIVGIAALALSGIAVADHKPDHDRGKGKGPGPKVSVDITNLCEFGDGSMDNPIPDNILRVTTTVEDVSDDPRRAVDVESVTVTGLQFVEPVDPPKKEKWKAVGAEVTAAASETQIDLYTIEFVREIDVCQVPVLEDAAKALNAHVQVKLPDGEVFMRMCDDPFLEGDDLTGDGEDDVDQSRIDLDDFVASESCGT